MIDKRYQRKPKKDHPWVGWKPGFLSKADELRKREPPKRKNDK